MNCRRANDSNGVSDIPRYRHTKSSRPRVRDRVCAVSFNRAFRRLSISRALLEYVTPFDLVCVNTLHLRTCVRYSWPRVSLCMPPSSSASSACLSAAPPPQLSTIFVSCLVYLHAPFSSLFDSARLSPPFVTTFVQRLVHQHAPSSPLYCRYAHLLCSSLCYHTRVSVSASCCSPLMYKRFHVLSLISICPLLFSKTSHPTPDFSQLFLQLLSSTFDFSPLSNRLHLRVLELASLSLSLLLMTRAIILGRPRTHLLLLSTPDPSRLRLSRYLTRSQPAS